MSKIGFPPGKACCDWCHKPVAWRDAQMTMDNEVLCPGCWPQYVKIVGADDPALRVAGESLTRSRS